MSCSLSYSCEFVSSKAGWESKPSAHAFLTAGLFLRVGTWEIFERSETECIPWVNSQVAKRDGFENNCNIGEKSTLMGYSNRKAGITILYNKMTLFNMYKKEKYTL